MIDATIQIAFVFALQLLCFFCGYVSGIRRGQAMELKRWRRRHQPRLSDLLLAARERDRQPPSAGPHLPPLPPAPRFRPDWSPCSQPPNDPPSEP